MTMWVFGYGSLLWNPGFEPREQVIATLPGYHRSFCMRSIHHRGTEDNPGLVLALDEAEKAHCAGLALSVADHEQDDVLAYLRERELVSSAYLEKMLYVDLSDGRRVEAVTYVIDPHHVQYCGALALEEQAQIIAQAVGGRGPNTEYLFNTSSHLQEMGVQDDELNWLVQRVRQPFNANRVAQRAASVALRLQDRVAERRETNRRRLDALEAGLHELGCSTLPSQTNFLLVRPPEPIEGLFDRLLRQGAIVRPMGSFGLGEGSFRVNTGTEEENAIFLSGLGRVMRGEG